MRIYIGWKIKTKSPEANQELDGAEVVGNFKIRKAYKYIVKLKSGIKKSIRREEMLNAINENLIEFYV